VLHTGLLPGYLAFFLAAVPAFRRHPLRKHDRRWLHRKLRVAFLLVPLYATKDPATGELKGIAPDLGRQVAQRLGVPFDPVIYPNLPRWLAARSPASGTGALWNQRRACCHHGFLGAIYGSRAGVPRARRRPNHYGIRGGQGRGPGRGPRKSRRGRDSLPDTEERDIIRVKSQPESAALLDAGKADVYAATKTALFGVAASRPGSRMLEGRFLVEPSGMAVPKGRNPAAVAYVSKFVEEAKADGLVKSAIERAGLRGVVVAPAK